MERTVITKVDFTKKIDLTEIEKLHNLLTKAKVPHTYRPLYEGMQIRIYADEEMTNELDDVVCHKYSYGREKGLLETFHLNGCEGFETADEVFAGWIKQYKKAREVNKNA